MEQRFYHGNIKPLDIATALITHFNRGNLRVQQIGGDDEISVQIASSQQATSGGKTAIGIHIQGHEDGISIQIGPQAWLGVAASLGWTAISALRNPLTLLSRIDDLAQDIEYMQLTDEIWRVITMTTSAANATHQLSDRLRRLVCPYCLSATPVGEASCLACGAPLGIEQPSTCPSCGFVVDPKAMFCGNCGGKLS